MNSYEGTGRELLDFLATPHGRQCRRFWVAAAGVATAAVAVPRSAFLRFVNENAPSSFRWETGHVPGVGWVLQVNEVKP
jgi:hypothetical protein